MEKTTLFEVPADDEGVRNRKEEWREIKKVLDVMDGYVKKRHQRIHNELFFSGQIDSELLAIDGGEIFDYALPFFEMWYQPSVELEEYRKIFDKQTKPFALERARDRFLFYRDYHEPQLFTPYGRLGGREKLLVETLVLSADYEDVIAYPEIDAVYHKGMTPGNVLDNCRLATKMRLEGAQINPYVPGQYLWDYIGPAYETLFSDSKYVKRLEAEKKFMPALFRLLRLYAEHKGPAQSDETVAALAESILGRFQRREFPEAFMSLWEETACL